MEYLFYFFIFIFGLIIGSFLNCVIYRQESGETLGGRSHCMNCNHVLNWQDLLPVFSFILLKGKCRYCGKKISWQYILVEIATGLLFVQIYNFHFLVAKQFQSINSEDFFALAYLFTIASLLVVIFVYDFKHFLIPDNILLSAVAVTAVYRLAVWLFVNLESIKKLKLENFEQLSNPLFSAIGASVLFLVIYLATRGKGMGFGDVKLAFFIGLFLGYPGVIVALFLSFFAGAIVGLCLMAIKKKNLKSEVPFGPFLIFGTFTALFWSQAILNWYLNFLK